MAENARGSDAGHEHESFRIRLPGFIVEDEVGLGDLIKRITYASGITPCSGCNQRADALNRRIAFTSTKSKRT